MTRRTLPIEELDVAAMPRMRKEQIALHVLDDLPGPLRLPALVVSGHAPGPTLVAVAGVHGNEYEGMEAIRRCFAALDPAALLGTFLGIPVANPLAYAARSRVTPADIDGLNLARVFPGTAGGTLTQRLAHSLLQLVVRNVGPNDLFIDLHSGSGDVTFATIVGFRDIDTPARASSEEAARHFGLPHLWRIPDSPGPFNAETARRGIPTIGTETAGRGGLDAAGAAAFANGLHNLAAHLGMLSGTPPQRYVAPARATIDLVAPTAGFFRAAVTLHDDVLASTALGVIIDVYGDTVDTVRALESGTVWAIRETPAVRPGELIAMVALP